MIWTLLVVLAQPATRPASGPATRPATQPATATAEGKSYAPQSPTRSSRSPIADWPWITIASLVLEAVGVGVAITVLVLMIRNRGSKKRPVLSAKPPPVQPLVTQPTPPVLPPVKCAGIKFLYQFIEQSYGNRGFRNTRHIIVNHTQSGQVCIARCKDVTIAVSQDDPSPLASCLRVANKHCVLDVDEGQVYFSTASDAPLFAQRSFDFRFHFAIKEDKKEEWERLTEASADALRFKCVVKIKFSYEHKDHSDVSERHHTFDLTSDKTMNRR